MRDPEPLRAVLFARVSDPHGKQDPESQLIPLRAAARRHGWEVAEEVALKLSAWGPREAADAKQQALAPFLEGRADVLAVWAFDRLCREGIQPTLALLQELEVHLGVHVYSLQEPFLSTATSDPAMRELMRAFMAWLANQESSRRSARLRAKAQRKREAAEKLGQRARWGRGVMATDEDRELVKQLLAEEKSIRDVSAATGLSKSTVGRIKKELDL